MSDEQHNPYEQHKKMFVKYNDPKVLVEEYNRRVEWNRELMANFNIGKKVAPRGYFILQEYLSKDKIDPEEYNLTEDVKVLFHLQSENPYFEIMPYKNDNEYGLRGHFFLIAEEFDEQSYKRYITQLVSEKMTNAIKDNNKEIQSRQEENNVLLEIMTQFKIMSQIV